MKQMKFLMVLCFILVVISARAQQDPLFTQYMTNPITINPAIAGMRNVNNISLVSRQQWLGIDGAPTTLSLAYQGALNDNKVGVGVNLIHDRIGPVVQTGLYFDYSYRLQLNEEKDSRLSLGLMGGFNYYVYDLISLHYNGQDDDITADGYNERFLPNFGLGALYYSPNFFFGFSIPKILRNSLSATDNSLTINDKEERHYFAMAGAIFDINEDLKFKPSIITRAVTGAPVSLDLNATFMFFDKIWLGALYRVNSSWGGIIRWQINDKLHIGYSFDYANSRLKSYNSGTHEIFISFDIVSKDKIENVVRFF